MTMGERQIHSPKPQPHRSVRGVGGARRDGERVRRGAERRRQLRVGPLRPPVAEEHDDRLVRRRAGRQPREAPIGALHRKAVSERRRLVLVVEVSRIAASANNITTESMIRLIIGNYYLVR